MKKNFLRWARKKIQLQYPNYSNDKLNEIMYGVEGIYLTITKSIIIIGLSIILGIFKELIYLLIAFNIIRLFAFGMHASKSSSCLLLSSSVFIIGAFLCRFLVLNKNILYMFYFINLIIISLYAPADTVKRPLIKRKKRIKYKILSLMIVLIYFIISIFVKNNLVINSMILGTFIESVLISPITYKIFKMPYKNYINYGLNT